ncbi:RING finger protein [Kutzneria buriramensis]|uniref:RING finger family protein n=1 Tax=Kutzneria buriramensis TaxID=1045776 RepID=A0A3E0HL57_9PSEU|nr:RING finger protein [Kutzneria buriramensis]REH47222.1 RING finger family protein [Kutzneria buriramensis]
MSSTEIPMCAICRDNMESSQFADGTAVTLECSHSFHRICIATWIATNPTCPLCRGAIGATDMANLLPAAAAPMAAAASATATSVTGHPVHELRDDWNYAATSSSSSSSSSSAATWMTAANHAEVWLFPAGQNPNHDWSNSVVQRATLEGTGEVVHGRLYFDAEGGNAGSLPAGRYDVWLPTPRVLIQDAAVEYSGNNIASLSCAHTTYYP